MILKRLHSLQAFALRTSDSFLLVIGFQTFCLCMSFLMMHHSIRSISEKFCRPLDQILVIRRIIPKAIFAGFL